MTTNYILKYRPRFFREVIGQELVIGQIVNYLNSIREDSTELIQPILIVGPRGVGKTTTVRLIAQFLNCENPQVDNLCTCSICNQITKNSQDYYELDGGSKNGVDAVGNIIDISYRTPHNKFMIIFIDEAHNLSGAAYTKLLHAFEEPPKNVLYVLGTTAENRIDDALKSRCKLKQFKPISKELIKNGLDKIIDLENNRLSTNPDRVKIVELITTLGHGSMRMSLSKLSDVLDLSVIDWDNVKSSVGVADYKTVIDTLKKSMTKIGEGLASAYLLKTRGVGIKITMTQFNTILNDLLNSKAGCSNTAVFSPDYYNKEFPDISLNQVASILEVYIKFSNLSYNNPSFELLNLILTKIYLEISKTPKIVQIPPAIAKVEEVRPIKTSGHLNGSINGYVKINGTGFSTASPKVKVETKSAHNGLLAALNRNPRGTSQVKVAAPLKIVETIKTPIVVDKSVPPIVETEEEEAGW